MVFAVGEEHASAVHAPCRDRAARVERQSVVLTVNAHAGRAGAVSKQIGRLRDRVVRTVDVQSDAERCGAGRAVKIRRAGSIALKVALRVRERVPVGVDRTSEPLAAVERIADVLHHGQFHFHERRVVGVDIVGHHALGLDVAQLRPAILPAVDAQAADTVERFAAERFGDVVADEVGLARAFAVFPVLSFDRGEDEIIALLQFSSRKLITAAELARRDDLHAGSGGVEVFVDKMQGI